MAEGTRSQTIQNQFVDECKARFSKQEQQLADFSTLLKEISIKLTTMEGRIEQNFRNPATIPLETSNSKAGVTPFVVAGIEFSKRIIAQRRCQVCRGSGLILTEKDYFKCPECGGFLPWQSWRRFFSG